MSPQAQSPLSFMESSLYINLKLYFLCYHSFMVADEAEIVSDTLMSVETQNVFYTCVSNGRNLEKSKV